jgi:hypothetical protein
LPPDLKLTINPKGYFASEYDDDDEPFQRAEDPYEPVISKDIEDADIKIGADLSKLANSRDRKSLLDKEPEPEFIKSSDSEGGSARKDTSKVKNNNSNGKSQRPSSFTRLTNSQANQGNTNVSAEEIDEELDDDDEYADD